MTNDEMWQLLIRLDERTAASSRWEEKHDLLHQRDKAVRWKYLAPLYTALVAAIAKMIFWN